MIETKVASQELNTFNCAQNRPCAVVDNHFLGSGHVCDEPSLSIIVGNGRPDVV